MSKNHAGATGSVLLDLARSINSLGYRAFPVDAEYRPLVTEYRGIEPFNSAELRRLPWEAAANVAVSLPAELVALTSRMLHPDIRVLGRLEKLLGSLPETATLEQGAELTTKVFTLHRQFRDRMLTQRLEGPRGQGALVVSHRWNGFLTVSSVEELERAVCTAQFLPKLWTECLTIAKAPRFGALQSTTFQCEEASVYVLHALASRRAGRATIQELCDAVHLSEGPVRVAILELRDLDLVATVNDDEVLALFTDLPIAFGRAMQEHAFLELAQRSVCPAQGLLDVSRLQIASTRGGAA